VRRMLLPFVLASGLAFAGCGAKDEPAPSPSTGAGTPPAAAPSPGSAIPALAGMGWLGDQSLDLAAASGKIRAVAFFKPG
jgi:hypothetical protein